MVAFASSSSFLLRLSSGDGPVFFSVFSPPAAASLNAESTGSEMIPLVITLTGHTTATCHTDISTQSADLSGRNIGSILIQSIEHDDEPVESRSHNLKSE
jgi:hypothetical protein